MYDKIIKNISFSFVFALYLYKHKYENMMMIMRNYITFYNCIRIKLNDLLVFTKIIIFSEY